MAHEFLMPVVFDFRATKTDWVAYPAHVVGWWARKGTPDTRYLQAEFAGPDGTDQFPVPVAWLPEDDQKRCVATLRKPGIDKAVKEICSALELQWFHHNATADFDQSELRKN